MKPETILGLAQFIIVLVGAIWAYFRVWKEGVHNPRIQFDIECLSFESQHENTPVEFRIVLKNKGLLIHRFRNIKLRVRGIQKSADLEYWKENEPRLLFPNKLIDAEVLYKKNTTISLWSLV